MFNVGLVGCVYAYIDRKWKRNCLNVQRCEAVVKILRKEIGIIKIKSKFVDLRLGLFSNPPTKHIRLDEQETGINNIITLHRTLLFANTKNQLTYYCCGSVDSLASIVELKTMMEFPLFLAFSFSFSFGFFRLLPFLIIIVFVDRTAYNSLFACVVVVAVAMTRHLLYFSVLVYHQQKHFTVKYYVDSMCKQKSLTYNNP